MRSVKKYMTSPIFQVEENTSLQEVCKLMLERGVGSVVVTRNGEPIGIFTDRDAVKAIASGLSPSDEVKLASTIGNIITIDEDTDVLQAIRIMSENKIRHLPVRDKNGKIIGMFAITDISRALIDISS
jgi:CBS domain-containing protein